MEYFVPGGVRPLLLAVRRPRRGSSGGLAAEPALDPVWRVMQCTRDSAVPPGPLAIAPLVPSERAQGGLRDPSF